MVLNFNRSDYKLLLNISKMGLRDRFLGSSLGLIWAIANPIIMLTIFSFVFGYIFNNRLPGAENSLTYLIWLISGYGPWLAISEGISNGTSAVASNGGLVKNIAFKTELLPISYSLLGLVPFIVSTLYLLVLMFLNGSHLYSNALLALPILALQIIFVSGIVLYLSCLNVFIRDVSVVLPNILIILLFISPIFYPIESLPMFGQKIVKFNPIYIISDSYRQVILEGQWISWQRLLYLLIVSSVVFISGLMFFRKFKSYFDSRI